MYTSCCRYVHSLYIYISCTQEARLLRYICSSDPHDVAHIVRLHSSFMLTDGGGGCGGTDKDSSGHACLILERLSDTSLYDYIRHLRMNRMAMTSDSAVYDARKVGIQLCLALTHLSNLEIIHGDVKPENVVFVPGRAQSAGAGVHMGWSGAQGLGRSMHGHSFGVSAGSSSGLRLKLIDFGCSMFASEAKGLAADNMEVQTLAYRAPEILKRQYVGLESDAWALGCILAEILLRDHLFDGNSPDEVLCQITEQLGVDTMGNPRHMGDGHRGVIPPLLRRLMEVDMCFADLVWGFLQWDSNARLTPQAALLHPAIQRLTPIKAVARMMVPMKPTNVMGVKREEEGATGSVAFGGNARERSSWLCNSGGFDELHFIRAVLARARGGGGVGSSSQVDIDALDGFKKMANGLPSVTRQNKMLVKPMSEAQLAISRKVASPSASPAAAATAAAAATTTTAVDNSSGKKWEAVRSVLKDFCGKDTLAEVRNGNDSKKHLGGGLGMPDTTTTCPSSAAPTMMDADMKLVGEQCCDQALRAEDASEIEARCEDDNEEKQSDGGASAGHDIERHEPEHDDTDDVGAKRRSTDAGHRRGNSRAVRARKARDTETNEVENDSVRCDSMDTLPLQRSSRNRGGPAKPWWVVQN